MFSEQTMKILNKRYLLKNEKGEVIETPEQLFRRVAKSIAFAEKDDELRNYYEEQFYNILISLKFLPNSPTLFNAGLNNGLLSACFTLDIEDDMSSIFETLRQSAIIFQRGGGIGYNFSKLRPKNSIVKSSGGFSSGPISFMEVYDKAIGVISQGGKRRGAAIGILMCHHPDIEDFIVCKDDKTKLTNFNISVGITDSFMNAVKNDDWWWLVFEDKKYKKVKAKSLWHQIVKQSHKNGEPGLLFFDTINKENKSGELIYITNPCGEQPLEAYGSCNLGSIDVSKFFLKKTKNIDWIDLEKTIKLAVRFLDNVIDINYFVLKEIEEKSKKWRRIGLGIMGWSDLLLKMKIKYDSQEHLDFIDSFMSKFKEIAHKYSEELGEEKGEFPAFSESKLTKKRRNVAVTTIAPTGSLSLIANCSSGIEPVYSKDFVKVCLDNNQFEKSYENNEYLRTALEISPEWHVKVQAQFQKYIDSSISKTCNLPKNATIEDVEKTLFLAWDLGCKGITIYRDGSRDEQVYRSKEEIKKENKNRERPDVLAGKTIKTSLACGASLFITINSDDEGIREIFLQGGKSGGCLSSFLDSTGKLASKYLKVGGDAKEIIKDLKGIRCGNSDISFGKKKTLSCADALARAIEEYLQEDVKITTVNGICPECGNEMSYESGCSNCKFCGYSKCL